MLRKKSTGRFLIPSEQTLAGLIGTVEIPVSVSEFSSFGSRIHEQSLESEQVNSDLETSLNEAVSAGRRFSREVLAADERTNQARAQSGQALANLLPSLTVRKNSGKEKSHRPRLRQTLRAMSFKRKRITPTDSVWTLKQPLIDMPGFFDYRRRGVIELARDENRRAADGEAYLASVNAYLSLISTRLQADMAADFERQLNELLAYIDKRASAGASSMADLARVRARSQAAASSRLEQESAHTAAGVEFVRLTTWHPGSPACRIPRTGVDCRVRRPGD